MNYLFALPKDSAKSSGGYNVFPVGIAYVTAYLKQHGHHVVTANLEFFKESTYDALLQLIRSNATDVFCTGGLSRDLGRVKELLDAAKSIKPSIMTVVGGGIVTGDPQPAMVALGADIGVIGQGEVTMQELAYALDHGLPYEGVAGTIHKKHGRYVTTAIRKEIRNLDDLPMPDYDGFAFSDYMRQIGHQCAYIIASRSCPFNCTFCFHPSGNVYRRRSLDSVFSEIDYLLARFPVKTIVISDELFAPSRNRVIEFCNRIATYGLGWEVQLRVSDVDDELLDIMRDAGCSTISYGIESADDSILSSMKKKITVAQIDHALRLTHDRDIDIQGGLIFGDAAETADTVANSLAWYDAHPEYGLELNMINIFPGTALYHQACARGIIKDKVAFLRDGCPLVNVSCLSDGEYRDLSSRIYERNIRAKYQPDFFRVRDFRKEGDCIIDVTCNKCGNQFSVEADALHVTRVRCNQCRQRYYLDPFQTLAHSCEFPGGGLGGEDRVALWGSGEICVKMLDRYPVLQEDRFIVIDKSRSRQGYTVCGKRIFAPDRITDLGISTVIVTVVRRASEILRDIVGHSAVTSIYIPVVSVDTGHAAFGLSPIDRHYGRGIPSPCPAARFQ